MIKFNSMTQAQVQIDVKNYTNPDIKKFITENVSDKMIDLINEDPSNFNFTYLTKLLNNIVIVKERYKQDSIIESLEGEMINEHYHFRTNNF